jgi:hypothetical protein
MTTLLICAGLVVAMVLGALAAAALVFDRFEDGEDAR